MNMSQVVYDQFGKPFQSNGAGEWTQVGEQGWVPPIGQQVAPSPAAAIQPMTLDANGLPYMNYDLGFFNPYAMNGGMGMAMGQQIADPNFFPATDLTINPALLGGVGSSSSSSSSATPYLTPDLSAYTTPDMSMVNTPSPSRIPSPSPEPKKYLPKKRKPQRTLKSSIKKGPRGQKKEKLTVEQASILHAVSALTEDDIAGRTCSVCHYLSDTKTLHRRHMLSHSHNSHKCDWCPVVLSRRDAVLRHMRETCKYRHLHEDELE
ncbi:hypothetical protein EXIGLDRAFT_751671 [Exidia glandulosa HHB12029]|uniref:C2H2-type domain-containing protein n=1 Tax=Exidia glandulosa HHB12029 TaxID=1314781 RepID=A0A165F6X8_EXIGL|nr:hypothetical protein EXIGLDRAFT_751671 [Exidia glandulosa HHB12029]